MHKHNTEIRQRSTHTAEPTQRNTNVVSVCVKPEINGMVVRYYSNLTENHPMKYLPTLWKYNISFVSKPVISFVFSTHIKQMEISLCPPATLYLVFSTIVLILFFVQNVGNTHSYCLGERECDAENKSIVLLIQMLYILLFTLILNTICDSVSPFFSWILVIIGILFFFISTGLFIVHNSKSYINLFVV